jgi:hypothetical protein
MTVHRSVVLRLWCADETCSAQWTICASVVGIVTAQLRILLPTLLLDMKHDATDRFMRDTICSCYDVQRFLQLHHTMHHSRPL